MNNQGNNTENGDILQDFFENFDVKLLWYIAKKSSLFILILWTLGFLIPYLFVRYTTPIYQTKATLIKKKEYSNAILDEKKTDFLKSNDEEKINRDIQIIKSDLLLESIIDSLDLQVEYYKKGRLPTKRFELSNESIFKLADGFEVYNPIVYDKEIEIEFVDNGSFHISYERNGKGVQYKDLKTNKEYSNKDFKFKVIAYLKDIEGDYTFKFNSREYIKKYIQGNVNVINASPNIFFEIKGVNNRKSERLLDGILNGFLNLDQKENAERVESSITYIKGFIDTINIQLKESQREKVGYVKSNSIYDPSSQLSNSLTEVELYKRSIEDIELKLNSIKNLRGTYSSGNSSLGAYEDVELNKLLLERKKLLIDYKPSHPTLLLIDGQIEDRIQTINNKLQAEAEEYKQKIERYRSRKSQVLSNLSELPERNMELNSIQKEVDIKEKYVLDLIEKQIQYLIIKSSISSDYLIIQPPKTESEQIFPKKGLAYIVGFIFFLFLSITLILYRYLSLDRVVSLNEIKRKTDVPILGLIPFVEEAIDETNRNQSSPESKLVVLSNFKSRISEVFKKVRASLKYTSQSDYKTICTTSTVSGEGKTFMLINLAAVHALLDKKVIIVDLDMRKPRIAKSFKLSNTLGMSNLLTDDSVSLDDCIHKGVILDNMDIISSGPVPPNPSELILSAKFDRVLSDLKERYDYIFIDTPPIGLVNESIEIVNKVDVALYMVKLNFSKKDFSNVLNETNNLRKDTSLYLVVNHYGDGASAYVNYQYGYGYGYGSSYGYHSSNDGYYTDKPKQVSYSLIERIKKFFNWDL